MLVHTVKGEVKALLHAFLTSSLCGSERSASHSGHFISGERNSGILSIGGWVGPGAGLDIAEKRKLSCLCRNSNHEVLIIHPVTSSLYRLTFRRKDTNVYVIRVSFYYLNTRLYRAILNDCRGFNNLSYTIHLR